MSRIEWHGDKTDGIEFRYQDANGSEFLDEVCVYVSGQCVVHLELMSDTCYWMGLYAGSFGASVNIFSKNGRSFLDANADGWTEDCDKRVIVERAKEGRRAVSEILSDAELAAIKLGAELSCDDCASAKGVLALDVLCLLAMIDALRAELAAANDSGTGGLLQPGFFDAAERAMRAAREAGEPLQIRFGRPVVTEAMVRAMPELLPPAEPNL